MVNGRIPCDNIWADIHTFHQNLTKMFIFNVLWKAYEQLIIDSHPLYDKNDFSPQTKQWVKINESDMFGQLNHWDESYLVTIGQTYNFASC